VSISRVKAVRAGLAAAALTGVICLLLATFATVIEIKVGTATRVSDRDTHLSGWDRHGPALIVIAAFAAVMVAGALRGARPAMVALVALGLAALLIAVVGDVPDLDETGFIGQVYEDAAAGPEAGFYLETLGALLLLGAGGVMLGLATADAP
jgi:putative exporter of polyketide antibiotics